MFLKIFGFIVSNHPISSVHRLRFQEDEVHRQVKKFYSQSKITGWSFETDIFVSVVSPAMKDLQPSSYTKKFNEKFPFKTL